MSIKVLLIHTELRLRFFRCFAPSVRLASQLLGLKCIDSIKAVMQQRTRTVRISKASSMNFEFTISFHSGPEQTFPLCFPLSLGLALSAQTAPRNFFNFSSTWTSFTVYDLF
jgi:hypothetical protein